MGLSISVGFSGSVTPGETTTAIANMPASLPRPDSPVTGPANAPFAVAYTHRRADTIENVIDAIAEQIREALSLSGPFSIGRRENALFMVSKWDGWPPALSVMTTDPALEIG